MMEAINGNKITKTKMLAGIPLLTAYRIACSKKLFQLSGSGGFSSKKAAKASFLPLSVSVMSFAFLSRLSDWQRVSRLSCNQ